MPKREITVPVLPVPDVPNASGIVYTKELLDNAIKVFMERSMQPVLLQKENQVGDIDADTDLDKICGSIADITYNDESKSYVAQIKLNPNKNSAFILDEIEKGNVFTLGMNKIGTLQSITSADGYPEGSRYTCRDGMAIDSTSIFDTNLLILPETPDGEIIS